MKTQTITEPSTPTSIFTQEERKNVELIRKITNEAEDLITILRNQDWKKDKIDTEKIKRLLKYLPTNNITELNELIYAGVKLDSAKIRIPPRESDQDYKP